MPTTPVAFTKTRNLSGLASVSISAQVENDGPLRTALVQNRRFPSSDIAVGKISLSSRTGKPVKLESGSRTVSFSASAGAYTGLSVYSTPAKLLDDLRPDDDRAPQFSFPEQDNQHFVMLRWGYDLAGSATGAMGLAAGGSLTFGADVKRHGAYAVVRRLPVDRGARSAVQDVVESWILPRRIHSPEQLEPGSWVITEVDGAIAATLGVQYGFDYNWLRETKLGALQGDIGLRLNAAIDASLGFHASGRYLLSIGRESSAPVIRIRVFKLSRNGWDFGLNMGVTLKADLDRLLPDNPDDFVKAVFGVHGAQIIEDLRAIEKWTDPGMSPGGALAGLTSEYGQDLLTRLTGIDASQAFARAQRRATRFLTAWSQIDRVARATLWRLVEQRKDTAPIGDIAALIANSPSRQAALAALGERASSLEFLRGPEGQVLDSLTPDGLFAALASDAGYRALRRAVKNLQRVLNRPESLGFLAALRDLIDERLNLDQVLELSTGNFGQLDAWLQTRLAAFLDRELNLERFQQLRAAIHELLDKRKEYYQKGLEAARRGVEARVAYTYQRTTERDALIDASFDFSGGRDLSTLLQKAVGGRFDDLDQLAVTASAGVTLHQAAGSHRINRSATVDLTLPTYKTTRTSITDSMARWSAQVDSGRLLLYELDASNTVRSRWHGRMSRDSTLAIAGAWRAQLASGAVRLHGTPDAACTYSFRQARKSVRKQDLLHRIGAYVKEYFPEHFTFDQRPFSVWVESLDVLLEQREQNGIGNIGDTVFELDLTLPGNVLEAWLRPRPKNAPEYRALSRGIQAELKRILPQHYFSDPGHWGSPLEAAPLLLYAAFPPRARQKDLHWNTVSKRERAAMAAKPQTRAALASLIADYGPVTGFRPGDETLLIRLGLTGLTNLPRIEVLLRAERRIVHHAAKSARAFSAFLVAAGDRPSVAVEKLAQAGVTLTEAFNKEVHALYGGGEVRAYGPWLFAQAARALGGAPPVRPSAKLYLAVLKSSSTFPLPDFLADKTPPPTDLAFEDLFQYIETST